MTYTKLHKSSSWNPEIQKKNAFLAAPPMAIQTKSVSGSPQEEPEMPSYTPLSADGVANHPLMRSLSENALAQASSQVETQSLIQRTEESLLDEPIPADFQEPVLEPESSVDRFLDKQKKEREAELVKMGGGAVRTKDTAKGVVNLGNLQNRPKSNFADDLEEVKQWGIKELLGLENQEQNSPEAEANQPSSQGQEGTFVTTPLHDRYKGEGEEGGSTYYPDTLDPYKLSISEGNLMQDGEKLDTTKSKRLYKTEGSKDGRFIYTMDSEGEFTAGDEKAERLEQDKNFHHSSLRQGDEVAGAGELQVRDGKVEVISDRSGHYQPPTALTHQVAKSLESKGVEMERVGVELEAKEILGGYDSFNLSAVEFLAYEPEMKQAMEAYKKFESENSQVSEPDKQQMRTLLLSHPEKKIRDSHAKQDKVLKELKQKTQGRKEKSEETAVHGEGKAEIKAPETPVIKELADKTNIKFGRLIKLLKRVKPATDEEETALGNVPDIETKLQKAYKELATLDD
ncbi:MAG: hypothetical protein AB1861_05835 [Cyanobacteriota bacterium]